MDWKLKKKIMIGMARIKNAHEIQEKMVNRLNGINSNQSEEEWINKMDVLADCILRSSYEIQKAARKIKAATAKADELADADERKWVRVGQINEFIKNSQKED